MLYYFSDEKRSISGFSLIEVLIVLAIVSILASVAYPSYQNSVRKGNRTAAQGEMMDIANRQKQYLLANRSYATKAQLTGNGFSLSTDVDALYDWDVTVGNGSAPSYTLTFTAKGAQLADGNMTLNSIGEKTPAAHW